MANFDEDIKSITEEVLSDGTIDKIIREKIEKGFESAIESAIKWGELENAIKKRVTEVLVPFIENYDMSAYVVKLDSVLTDIVNNSPLLDHKKLLENFRELMLIPEEKVIDLKDLFKAYKNMVAKELDTDGRDIDYEDGVRYSPAEVHVTVTSREKKSWSHFTYMTLDFTLDENEAQSDELSFEISLSRYNNTRKEENIFDLDYYIEPNIGNLRYINEFELLLLRLSRAGVMVRLEHSHDYDDFDMVYPDKEPELGYS